MHKYVCYIKDYTHSDKCASTLLTIIVECISVRGIILIVHVSQLEVLYRYTAKTKNSDQTTQLQKHGFSSCKTALDART